MFTEIKNNNIYSCLICNYNTARKGDYKKHLMSKKHIFRVNTDENMENDKFSCDQCNKSFCHRQSLWVHKKACKKFNHYVNVDISNNIIIDKNTFVQLVNDNQEFKQLLLDQNEKIIQLSSKENNITNNNNFNLNFFLNEKCKDAINWTDFIDRIEISYDDLENNAQMGFVKGISKILIDNLNQLALYERPIHCTDMKREIMYIKDDDKWQKEQDYKKITNAIQEISRKSIGSLIEWKESNIEYNDMDSEFSNKCIVIQQQSIAGNLREQYYPKIIQKIAKETIIDKKPEL